MAASKQIRYDHSTPTAVVGPRSIEQWNEISTCLPASDRKAAMFILVWQTAIEISEGYCMTTSQYHQHSNDSCLRVDSGMQGGQMRSSPPEGTFGNSQMLFVGGMNGFLNGHLFGDWNKISISFQVYLEPI